MRIKVREPLWSTRASARARAGARIGTLALCALFIALVAEPRSVLAYVAVSPASGGMGLLGGTSAPLLGPYVTEEVPGDIGVGAITLQAPPGFEFDTSQYVTATVTNEGCSPGEVANDSTSAAQDQYASTASGSAAPIEDRPLLLDGSTSQTVVPAPDRIKVTVTQPSSGDCIASVEWSGIVVKATAEASGNITKAPGGSVIAGVTDGVTSFGRLSATALPQTASAESTSSPESTSSAEPTASAESTASAEPTSSPESTSSAEPTASAEPTSSPESTSSAESTASAEPEQTDAAETTGPGETTGGSTPEEGVLEGVSSLSEGLVDLVSGFFSEEPESEAEPERQAAEPRQVHRERVTVSEGTATEERAPAEARSAMEPTTDYSQVVDNASPGRFSAPGWKVSSEGSLYYDQDYSYVETSQAAATARFKVKIPTTGYYTVYAWWPSAKGNSAATRFGVSTTSGVKWTEVNQQAGGGMWIRLGAYEMKAGDRDAVQVSPGSKGQGKAIADAVMVVSGTQVTPPDGDTGGATMSADSMRAAGGRRAELKDLVKVARWHIGTRYRSSPPHPCKAYRKEDCSCHTKVVFRELSGKKLPDDPVAQWRYGRRVSKSDLRPGDLVFFKEGRSKRITHVGFYSGNGNMVHASRYWGKVVERPMKYVDGYYGAKRVRPR